METLNRFLTETQDVREYKRALAVKLALKGYTYPEIHALLQVSEAFISKWKRMFHTNGVAGLRLGYRGYGGYLTSEERRQIIVWIQEQTTWSTAALQAYIRDTFAVEFQSLQSYYTLFDAAGVSWKKAQPRNPKKKPSVVAAKKQEIIDYVTRYRDEIACGERILLFLDECHLLWGDICGYIWGKRSERVEIPVGNTRERQTYYGALNGFTGQTLIHAYAQADTKTTIQFLNYLQEQFPGKKLSIIWDGASYHKYREMPDYLTEINKDLPPEAWKITCIVFAPNDPSQNPIEDVWLKAKTFIRQSYDKCQKFRQVKEMFEAFLHLQVFDFEKLHMYG